MRNRLRSSAAVFCACLLGVACADEPPGAARTPWWPSEFGAEDELGAANRLGPVKVLQAARLIRTGEITDMTRVFEYSMPLFSLTPHGRKYVEVTIAGGAGGPTYGPMGENALSWNEDFMAGHITQSGTQFDALSHMATTVVDESGVRGVRYYNGIRHEDIASGHGYRKLGVERVPPFFTRGVLLDIRGLLGRPMETGEEISVAQIRATLERQGLDESAIEPGDALFYNTGWGEYWKTDNEKFNGSAPGLSPAAGDWVIAKKVLMVGTDNWAVEAIPNPDARLFAPNHQKFLVEHGIYIMENLDFSGLIEKRAWQFAFVFGAIPFKGATGSPARAFAVH